MSSIQFSTMHSPVKHTDTATSLSPVPGASLTLLQLQLDRLSLMAKEEKGPNAAPSLQGRTSLTCAPTTPRSSQNEKEDFMHLSTPSPVKKYVRQFSPAKNWDQSPIKENHLSNGFNSDDTDLAPGRLTDAPRKKRRPRIDTENVKTAQKRPLDEVSDESTNRRVKRRLAIDTPTPAKPEEPFIPGKKVEFKGEYNPVCVEGNQHDKFLLNRITHSGTQVWSAKMSDPQNLLHSDSFFTFVPRSMTEAQFHSKLAHALEFNKCIARQQNKAILQLENDNSFLWVEVYFSDKGIRSAHPLFHFEMFNRAKETLRIEYIFKMSLDVCDFSTFYEIDTFHLLDLVKAHLSSPNRLIEENGSPIAYETNDLLFVDVALLDEWCPVAAGVIVAIPRHLLN